MKYVIVTGSSGLVGSEAVSYFHKKNFKVIGIDNDYRSYFFGRLSSTNKMTIFQKKNFKNFLHYPVDIRNYKKLEKIFLKQKKNIKCIIHTAAQPSHDWAASEPFTDFDINAKGTLNLLELTRKYSKDAVFIYVSTNKVYGDTPNHLRIVEKKTRYEIANKNKFKKGISESMNIDKSVHSLFGVSKLSGDLLAQEYGKYFDLKTGIFRLGCITGSNHAGAELHGFLSYLFKCIYYNKPYTVYGYKGKQVRDNIHSKDLINCFYNFYKKPRNGEVYNIGGGRKNSCSVLEAIKIIEKITKKKLKYKIVNNNRIGDHIWYITNNSKFIKDYPNWKIKINLTQIFLEMLQQCKKNKII